MALEESSGVSSLGTGMQGSLCEDDHSRPEVLSEKSRSINILLLDFVPFSTVGK